MDKSMIREALKASQKALSILAHPGQHRLISEALAELDKPGEVDPDAHLSDEDYLRAKQDRFAKGGLANVDPDKYMEEVRGTGKVLTDHKGHLPQGVDPITDVAHYVVCSFDHMTPYKEDIDGDMVESVAYTERIEEIESILAHALPYMRDHGYLAPANAPADVVEAIKTADVLPAMNAAMTFGSDEHAVVFSDPKFVDVITRTVARAVELARTECYKAALKSTNTPENQTTAKADNNQ